MGVVCVLKQKTPYEMRISDWSSDVCSSDLRGRRAAFRPRRASFVRFRSFSSSEQLPPRPVEHDFLAAPAARVDAEIGRASCRDRVCQYVSISVVAVSYKTNNETTPTTYIKFIIRHPYYHTIYQSIKR